MTILQATLLSKPPLSPFLVPALKPLRFSPLCYVSLRFRYRKLSITYCTLQPQQQNDVNSDSNKFENPSISDTSLGSMGENMSAHVDKGGNKMEGLSDGIEKGSGQVENEGLVVEEKEGRMPMVVFLVGLWAMVKRGFERIWLSGWMSWWPWHQEKRLDRLIAEADVNPTDAAKQSALLAELNKHSPETVIRRFEQRDHAVDSRGVVEYLRALVATNAIAEYLPDEESGKPSSLPSLLQELKQRASGNMEELSLSPGISEKQPLHVVMVDPKASSKSTRLAQELFSTILFTIAVGLVWYKFFRESVIVF